MKIDITTIWCRYFIVGVFLLQICLIMMVIHIGMRMDMYALFHAIWLLVLFAMKRSTQAKVWVFYLVFIAITLPFQYFMAIGLPPSLCEGKIVVFYILLISLLSNGDHLLQFLQLLKCFEARSYRGIYFILFRCTSHVVWMPIKN